MSYCVNCGVELAESEKYCPLCGVEVINPASPWKEPAQKPFPTKMERILKRADKKYYLSIASVLFLIPPLISLFSDVLQNGEVTWSAYVIAAMALVYVVGLTPFVFSKPHSILCVAIDCITLIPFLFVIKEASGGDWFLPIGLPMIAAAFVYVSVVVWLFEKKKPGLLKRMAIICFAASLMCATIEVILSLYNNHTIVFNWSPYVMSPCVLIGIAALVLERRRKLHDAVKKRFFV